MEGTTKMAREPGLEQRLLQRITLGWNLAEQKRIEEMGYDAYLEEQLDYASIDDSELESTLAERFPVLAEGPEAILRRSSATEAWQALLTATLLRAVYSPRQLYERMVIFWSDHFSIDLFSGDAYALKLVDDREVIRRHAMGRFPDLLFASAHSPAMLEYLTNTTNISFRPNENYARELMELHTLGADNGYDQTDVVEVARCLTGWSVVTFFPPSSGELGSFLFRAPNHDRDDKVVLGNHVPGSIDTADGEAMLDILARHPNTARFVSTKMARYFWGYEPPKNLIERLTQTYLATDGNIRSMLRVMLRKAWLQKSTPKLKRPFHLMVSALRALGAEIANPDRLLASLEQAGHLPFGWKPPNGYPDSEGYWSGYLLPRWDFALQFLGPDSGVSLEIPALDPVQNPTLTREKARARLDRQLTNRTLSGATKTVVRDYLAAGELSKERIDRALTLVLTSPEFQYY